MWGGGPEVPIVGPGLKFFSELPRFVWDTFDIVSTYNFDGRPVKLEEYDDSVVRFFPPVT